MSVEIFVEGNKLDFDVDSNMIFKRVFELGKEVKSYKSFRYVTNATYFDAVQDLSLYLLNYYKKYKDSIEQKKILIDRNTICVLLKRVLKDISRVDLSTQAIVKGDLGDYLIKSVVVEDAFYEPPDVNAYCSIYRENCITLIASHYLYKYDFSKLKDLFLYIANLLGEENLKICPVFPKFNSQILFSIERILNVSSKVAKNYLQELQRCLLIES